MIPKNFKNCLSKNLLTILTFVGVIVGITFGLILRNVKSGGLTKREIMYIQFAGDMFLRIFKALTLPLIVGSIVSAIGSLDLSLSGKIGAKSIFYFLGTTISAVILGIVLALTIRPGEIKGVSFKPNAETPPMRNITVVDTMLDLFRNLFPPNLVQACTARYRTVLVDPKNDSVPLNDWEIHHEYTAGTNTVGLVIFSIAMGLTLAKMGETGKPILNFFTTLSKAMILITTRLIWISPIAVMFLVASNVLEIKDLGAIVGQLGIYFVTVLIGLFLHGFGTLTLIYFICTRELPFKQIAQLSQALATAFGTSSSAATMPITLQCLDRMGLDPRITRFVVPLGTTIAMDGSAMWKALVTIFIAQIRNIPLDFGNILAIGVTTTGASIGIAGIPQAGMVVIVMILETVNLPAKDVSLILAVDWLLERFRTMINVLSDALGACIIEKLCRGQSEADQEICQREECEALQTHRKNGGT